MKFTKMHGIGNDYVYINCFEETVDQPAELSKYVSDRHFGVGSDGLILIKPSDKADFKMEIYNADGSQAQMCGNGIRCVGKYVFDHGMTDKTDISVETLAGIKYLHLTAENGKAVQLRVNMGSPELAAEKIPVLAKKSPVVDVPIQVCGKEYRMTCVSMGNPHAVIFAEDVMHMDLNELGPHFENHPAFPERVNTEFVEVLDSKNVNMRVWERGSGETLACGTGSCATAVACILNQKTEDEVTVHLLGGDLVISWDREKNLVYMSGSATTVFDGELAAY